MNYKRMKTIKRTRKQTFYTVHYYIGEWRYRTTLGVPKEKIKEIRENAKYMGEKIKIEKE